MDAGRGNALFNTEIWILKLKRAYYMWEENGFGQIHN